MKMIKSFLSKKEKDRNVVFWNLAGGALNAGQSALILMVLSRTTSQEDCGIFSLAYAIACLALTLGMFGVRNFQASDVRERYKFCDYFFCRLVTSLLMFFYIAFVVIRGYVFLGYSAYKSSVILLIGLIKIIDSIEDVLGGRLQQNGRLDIAAKSILVRYVCYYVSISVALFLSRRLFISFAVGFTVSSAVFILMYLNYREFIDYKKEGNNYFKTTFGIVKDCFVIAFGSFSMIYIANAPKYAIDAYMDEKTQAVFTYIFMPVYVVSTLSTYVFQPIISKMAEYLKDNDRKNFLNCFIRQMVIIVLLSLAVIVAGYFCGILFLNYLYKVELNSFKTIFMLLLVSGCILAFSSFLSVCIIVLRKQNYLVIGYIVSVLVSFVFSSRMVQEYQVMGAGVVYFISVSAQFIAFFVVFLVAYRLNAIKNTKKVG